MSPILTRPVKRFVRSIGLTRPASEPFHLLSGLSPSSRRLGTDAAARGQTSQARGGITTTKSVLGIDGLGGSRWWPRDLHRHPRQQRRSYAQKPTSPNPNPNPNSTTTPNLGSPGEPRTVGARLKKLSREYGWSALGVYLALSALDFPFCFLAVRVVGTERIGHAEHAVVSAFWRAVEWVVPDRFDKGKAVGEGEDGNGEVREGWGVEEAQAANTGEDASLWTQLALAYAIHKSFIFVRVPLTAAILPKVVKTLRGWGWNIGKRTSKAIKGSKD